MCEHYKRRLKSLLGYQMTDELKEEITKAILDEEMDSGALKNLIQKLRAHKVLLKPREEMDWNPTIDYEKCTNCLVCVQFCPRNVYEIKAGIPAVLRPTSCVLLCSKCMEKCPSGAIQFPPKEGYIQYIVYE